MFQGYEFDVGIHYIGEMNHQSLNKTLADQITEGKDYHNYFISYLIDGEGEIVFKNIQSR